MTDTHEPPHIDFDGTTFLDDPTVVQAIKQIVNINDSDLPPWAKLLGIYALLETYGGPTLRRQLATVGAQHIWYTHEPPMDFRLVP